MDAKDRGGKPYVVNIEEETKRNETFRTTLWTGTYLQMTVMNIPPGGDVGLEVHEDRDQFLRIEEGEGLVQMGPDKSDLNFEETAKADYAVCVPAGTWHNITNKGDRPMKLYSLYAPPEHPFGTVQQTQQDAERDEQKES